MRLKIHEAYRKIVALCDSNLIGRSFEEGIKSIEVKENFFNGEEKTKKEVFKILQDMNGEDATFFIVGKESVHTAIEAKVISSNGVMEIDGVPVGLGLF